MPELSEFRSDLFADLPWSVIYEILKYVPSDTISEGLLLVPQLRPLVLAEYYSNEIHFILSPTQRPHFCTNDPQRKELIDITSYGEIEDFLIDNPDANPTLVKVITSLDFRSMELLLNKFHDRFASFQKLDLHVDNYDLTNDDIKLIMSFPNLHKLQTGRVNVRKCSSMLSEFFPKMRNLTEIVFLGHGLSNWSNVVLPPNLTNLDVSWHPFTEVTSINLPDSLTNLYWNQVGIRNGVFESLKFPQGLTTLMVTYNNLHWINVSQLPQTLETLDLSNNNLLSFKVDGENNSWPPNLKSILLNNNHIDDHALEELSGINWPPLLENLRLDENKFTQLSYLSSLPEYLKYLDLSDTRISTFEVPHKDDEYPYFAFPQLLNTLNIQNCRTLKYGNLEAMTMVPPALRIRFPEDLETLNLSECNISTLDYFIFPKYVKKLSLTGNLILDLTSYNFHIGNKEVISWILLENLKELELFYNRISHLEAWIPPNSLSKLDLRRNQIKFLTSINTPLFNRNQNQKLTSFHMIHLEQNEIHTIDLRLTLPPNLTSLNLSRNNLSQFVFTDGFANHHNLSSLDLSWNQIEKISLLSTYAESRLSELNLTRNPLLRMNPDDFYKVLERMKLRVTKKMHNIRSVHQFR